MDFPLNHTPCIYPESVRSNPLPFQAARDENVMGREVTHHYSMRDYTYPGDWSLPVCNHLAE